MKGMLKQPQSQPSSQRLIINTPIRTRDGSQSTAVAQARGPATPSRMNKENQPSAQGMGGISPSKINPTRKPSLISKMQQQNYNTAPAQMPQVPQLRKTYSTKTNNSMLSSRRKECANHADKQAEFRINIDGQHFFYCYKCAASLVSQGFQMERLPAMRQNSSRPSLPTANIAELEQSKPVRVDPAALRHPRYQEVLQFTGEIEEVENSLRHNEEAYKRLPSHYANQFDLVEQFYDAMISYIQHVRTNHLEILHKESRKFTQIAEIQAGEISEALAQLNDITKDIKENVNDIVLKVAEEEYRECLNFYDQKVKLCKHRVEEDVTTLHQVTEMDNEVLGHKLTEFKAAVDDLLGVAEKSATASGNTAGGAVGSHGGFGGIISAHTKQSQSSNKQMFSNMQKKTTQPPFIQSTPCSAPVLPAKPAGTYAPQNNVAPAPSANPPFRNLFEEEESQGEEEHLPDQSPQFKNM